MQEFANDVIFTIKSVCDDEDVPDGHLLLTAACADDRVHVELLPGR